MVSREDWVIPGFLALVLSRATRLTNFEAEATSHIEEGEEVF